MRQVWLTIALACASTIALETSPLPQSTPELPPTSARTIRFASEALGFEYTFAILLPRTYAQTEKRYPVLYLLHPGGGSHTSFPSRIWFNKDASSRDMIVVLPNGGRSFFVNSVATPGARYEDVIVKDLIAYVDSHYRTVTTREGRAIAGISMGGFGATVIGLKHPQLFGTVGALSASLGSARDSAEATANAVQTFGPPLSPERRARDPLRLVTEVATGLAPYFFVSCGAEDGFAPVNREFAERLSARGISHEYREVPGTHSWDVWDSQLPQFFDVLFGQPGWKTR